MTKYQTPEAVTRQLYEEVSRLRAINAELVASIQKPVQADTSQIMSNGIKPNNSLVQVARQALEVLSELAEWESEGDPWHPASAAITALREALDAAHQPAAVGQEPVAWMFQHEEAGLIMCATVQQVESGFEKNNPRWQRVCPLYKAPQPARQPLTDKQIQGIWCSAKIEGNQHGPFWFARAIERAHGIGGEA